MSTKKELPNIVELEANSEPPKKKRKDRRVEREYTEMMEVIDPKTGLTIKQKVKVTKYKTRGARFTKPAVQEEELEFTIEDED